MNQHEVTYRYGNPWELKAGRHWVGECSCSNPDDFGDGMMEFYGANQAEIDAQFLEHLTKREEAA